MVRIIGAGITGVTLARRYAEAGHKVVIYERESLVGGLCRDHAGIYPTPDFGPHILHTGHEEVWEFLSRFTSWVDVDHRAATFTHEGVMRWPLTAKQADIHGDTLTRGFSRKMWGTEHPPGSAAARIRTDEEHHLYADKHIGVPRCGYTVMLLMMLDHPNIKLEYQWRNPVQCDINTGPPAPLDYRSITFAWTDHAELPYPVMYANWAALPFTRATDYSQMFRFGPPHVCLEIPFKGGKPCYPAPDDRAEDAIASLEAQGVRCMGRMGLHRYLDMDDAVQEALDFEL